MMAMSIELESCKNVCDMYLDKEAEFLSRIRWLEDENARLEMELDEANTTL